MKSWRKTEVRNQNDELEAMRRRGGPIVATCTIGEAIPAELYAAVIELLRVVWSDGAERVASSDNELES